MVFSRGSAAVRSSWGMESWGFSVDMVRLMTVLMGMSLEWVEKRVEALWIVVGRRDASIAFRRSFLVI